jgi:OmpA-OmpF porin, OOP family
MKNRSKLAFAAVAALVVACASEQPAPPPAPAPIQAPPPKPAVSAPAQQTAPAAVATPAPPKPVIEKLTMTADALFDFDKSDIRSDAKARLDDLAGKARGLSVEVILVVGHTDSVGDDGYNMKLSQRRADAVKRYLVGRGVPANRVYTEGKGEKSPIADNKTKEGRQKNRRSEIELSGTRTR